MKKALVTLIVAAIAIVLVTTISCSCTGKTLSQETKQATDTVKTFQVSSVIENIFYNLPLEKSRLELREVILNDKRFILTDTTFNDFPPPTFFFPLLFFQRSILHSQRVRKKKRSSKRGKKEKEISSLFSSEGLSLPLPLFPPFLSPSNRDALPLVR